jgi:hypothetical protein
MDLRHKESSFLLGVAQILWIATLLTLSWLTILQLATRGERILSIEGDYLMQESLKLAWLPTSYLSFMLMCLLGWLWHLLSGWRQA